AALAERHFVPLPGLVVVARLGERLALPDFLDALLEHVAHVGGAHTVEAAQAHAAVVVHRHGLVDDRAGHPLGRLRPGRKRAVLEYDAHAHDVDHSHPAVDELFLLVLVGALDRERHADPRQLAIAAHAEHAEYRRLDLGQLVYAAHFLQRLRRGRVEAEHDR